MPALRLGSILALSRANRKRPAGPAFRLFRAGSPQGPGQWPAPHGLRWGCDARYLAIEVTDLFGSLDRDTILRSLVKNDVRESGGGAGMGIALAYRSCDHLVFNLAPGKRTEIIALIDVRYPPAERTPVSSYNVFVERSA